MLLLASVTPLWADDAPKPGSLYLVGLGPGDPDLVTLKTARLLETADLVYCFGYLEATARPLVKQGRLTVASPLLMARCVRLNPEELTGAERQKALDSRAEQVRFVAELQEAVAAGKTVVLADAGDPTLFCPWLWILPKLTGISTTILPGISSFNAANAALGTDAVGRNSAILLSCGEELGHPNAEGRLETTLVFFVHRLGVQELIPRLLERYPADTPVALVCEAGYAAKQRVVRGTLGTILATISSDPISPLHLVYVGDGLAAPTESSPTCPCGKEK